MQELFAIGTICELTKSSNHKVRYAIDSRKIKPIGMIGNSNVYTKAQVAEITGALREIRSKHAAKQ